MISHSLSLLYGKGELHMEEKEMDQQSPEKLRVIFLEICPMVIDRIEDMIKNPNTPISAQVQLIAMVLDRALGKPEMPVKVSTEDTSFEEAEAMLMEIVREIQIEEGMVPKLTTAEAEDG